MHAGCTCPHGEGVAEDPCYGESENVASSVLLRRNILLGCWHHDYGGLALAMVAVISCCWQQEAAVLSNLGYDHGQGMLCSVVLLFAMIATHPDCHNHDHHRHHHHQIHFCRIRHVLSDA